MAYDIEKVKEELTIEQIYDIVSELGGDPVYKNSEVLICSTICHNEPGEGSNKLYYYDNTKLFQCYTTCGEYFDIFELVKKARALRTGSCEIYEAIYFVTNFFNLEREEVEEVTKEWKILNKYKEIRQIQLVNRDTVIKDYPSQILNNMNTVSIGSWEKEGMTREVLNSNGICYYPGNEQIIIPHYDENGRLIGIRGRALVAEDAERFGKYRPAFIGGTLYNHPLSLALYGLDKCRHIRDFGKAIVFESEKSVLLYQSYFGIENCIAVATCGSNLSVNQFDLLVKAGAQEIIIAFDRQYKIAGDQEYIKWTTKLLKLNTKFRNRATISFILDKEFLLDYKDSPIDKGREVFLKLFKGRIIL